MRAIQMVLCKTPFTPRYDNIVTGCTSHEFYTKLYNDENNYKIALDTGETNYKTQFNENSNNISFTISFPDSLDLNDYNYIAIKDITYKYDNQKVTFWFIDSFDVLNAIIPPSYTINCTKDFWHTYCLGLSIDDVYKQRIIRTHDIIGINGVYNETRPLIFETTMYPTYKEYEIHGRVLWMGVKVNLSYARDNTGRVDIFQNLNPTDYPFFSTLSPTIGFPFDGNIVTVYIPLCYVNNNNEFEAEIKTINFIADSLESRLFLTFLDIDRDKVKTNIETVTTLRAVNDLRSVGEKISKVGDHPMVLSSFLTYMPPFNYAYDNNYPQDVSVLIDRGAGGKTLNNASVNEVEGIVMFSSRFASPDSPIDDSRVINYTIPTIPYNNNSPDDSIKFTPPFNKYIAIFGNNSIPIPITAKNVTFHIKHKSGTNGYMCDVYSDNYILAFNLSSSPFSVLPLNSNSAYFEEAIYGSNYRNFKALSQVISGMGDNDFSITPKKDYDMTVTTAPILYQGTRTIFNMSKIGGMVATGGEIAKNLRQAYTDYTSKYRIPFNTSDGNVDASSLTFGDYPFIVNEKVLEEYNDFIDLDSKKYGEYCYKYDYITNMNREKFSYVKCENVSLYSSKISQQCNELICSILNRGVHLWNINNITSLNQIGDYSIENTEV